MSSAELDLEHLLVFGNMRAAVFYKTIEWKRARYRALCAHGNRCQLCGATAASGPLEVDHILPRSMFPDRCLDPTNLQILCSDCHAAKGMATFDDFRAKHTRIGRHMADFLRIERRYLCLGDGPPPAHLIRFSDSGVRASSKAHRSRWRLFVRFCHLAQLTYQQARTLSVGQFHSSPWAKKHNYYKFLYHGGNGLKHPDDLFFDIDGVPFPESLSSLLADDQRVPA